MVRRSSSAGGPDHVDLEAVAHAGLFEGDPHAAIEQADGRKVLNAREAHGLQRGEELRHQHERVGAVDAGEHRCVLHHRQHFARHLDHDLVGVAIGEQPGRRTAARHPVAARIVDHDEIDAAGFLALGGKACAGAAADDRHAAAHHLMKFLEDRSSVDGSHGRISISQAHGRWCIAASRAPFARPDDPLDNCGHLFHSLLRCAWDLSPVAHRPTCGHRISSSLQCSVRLLIAK